MAAAKGGIAGETEAPAHNKRLTQLMKRTIKILFLEEPGFEPELKFRRLRHSPGRRFRRLRLENNCKFINNGAVHAQGS